MAAILDLILNQFDEGKLSRRQLLTRLALVSGGALGTVGDAQAAEGSNAQAQGGFIQGKMGPPQAIDPHLVEPYEPIAPAASINHVHMNVKDLKRSMEFYSFVLGAEPKDSGTGIQTMTLPGARRNFGSWLSLSTYPDRYDHVLTLTIMRGSALTSQRRNSLVLRPISSTASPK
jgi:hypothetical protein